MSKKPTTTDLEQRINELTDALQRERADAMNVRRRSEEERAKLGNYYKSAVVGELLPVLDTFERALKHAPVVKRSAESVVGSGEKEKLQEWVQGVSKIVKQFEDTLAKIGVQRIKTVGVTFDPNLHEAVAMEEGEGHKEVVSEELQAGYTLGDEVIRHAMVKVRMEK